jgi:hypothetical protein
MSTPLNISLKIGKTPARRWQLDPNNAAEFIRECQRSADAVGELVELRIQFIPASAHEADQQIRKALQPFAGKGVRS